MTPERANTEAYPYMYGPGDVGWPGMTIKEYAAIQFQAAALQGMLIRGKAEHIMPTNAPYWANEHAKEMLKVCGYIEEEMK